MIFCPVCVCVHHERGRVRRSERVKGKRAGVGEEREGKEEGEGKGDKYRW